LKNYIRSIFQERSNIIRRFGRGRGLLKLSECRHMGSWTYQYNFYSGWKNLFTVLLALFTIYVGGVWKKRQNTVIWGKRVL